MVVFLGFNLEFWGFDRLNQPFRGLVLVAVAVGLAIACTSLLGQASRNTTMAVAVRNSINGRTAFTGYTASSTANSVTITGTAPALVGTVLNGLCNLFVLYVGFKVLGRELRRYQDFTARYGAVGIRQ